MLIVFGVAAWFYVALLCMLIVGGIARLRDDADGRPWGDALE